MRRCRSRSEEAASRAEIGPAGGRSRTTRVRASSALGTAPTPEGGRRRLVGPSARKTFDRESDLVDAVAGFDGGPRGAGFFDGGHEDVVRLVGREAMKEEDKADVALADAGGEAGEFADVGGVVPFGGGETKGGDNPGLGLGAAIAADEGEVAAGGAGEMGPVGGDEGFVLGIVGDVGLGGGGVAQQAAELFEVGAGELVGAAREKAEKAGIVGAEGSKGSVHGGGEVGAVGEGVAHGIEGGFGRGDVGVEAGEGEGLKGPAGEGGIPIPGAMLGAVGTPEAPDGTGFVEFGPCGEGVEGGIEVDATFLQGASHGDDGLQDGLVVVDGQRKPGFPIVDEGAEAPGGDVGVGFGTGGEAAQEEIEGRTLGRHGFFGSGLVETVGDEGLEGGGGRG